MAVVTMRQLLEAGVHFGHQTRRWNPKMKRFIYGERNGIYIIDLQKTSTAIESTYGFLRDTVAKGGNVLFVGTKKQAQESIKSQAERVGMPYVNFRWLGGMLTNFTTIYKRLQRLKELEAMVATGATDVLPKKEVLRLGHEREKLERNLGGIRDMTRLPAAVWIVDTRKEHIAVTEARKLGIPVVAILDTNCDPDEVDYPIPGNDDAIRAGSLLTRIVADAVAEGLRLRSVYASEAAGKEGAATISASPADEEPLAEWERELLESDSGRQAETSRFGKADGAAAAAAPSADKPASSGRSGSAGGRAGTQSRSGAKGATQAEARPAARPAPGARPRARPRPSRPPPPRRRPGPPSRRPAPRPSRPMPPRRRPRPATRPAQAPATATATRRPPTPRARARPAPTPRQPATPKARARPAPRPATRPRARRRPPATPKAKVRPPPSPTTRPAPRARARPPTPPRLPPTPPTRRGSPGPRAARDLTDDIGTRAQQGAPPDMEITAAQVKALRDATGAGMMDCRNALREAGGDLDKATQLLREAGKAGVEKRAGRSTTQGVVDAYLHTPDPNLPPKLGVLVELDCETDFVAKTDEFQRLAHEIALHIAVADPSYIRREEVPEDLLAEEREIYAKQAEGKPEHIVEKIVEGKLKDYYKQVVLLDQPYIRDDKQSIQDLLDSYSAKVREKLVLRRFARFKVGEGA